MTGTPVSRVDLEPREETSVAAVPLRAVSRVRSIFEGCYEAPRAAALAGVPVSTVYDWARKRLVVPIEQAGDMTVALMSRPSTQVAVASHVRPGDRVLDGNRYIQVVRVRRAQGRKPSRGENLHLVGEDDVVKVKQSRPCPDPGTAQLIGYRRVDMPVIHQPCLQSSTPT